MAPLSETPCPNRRKIIDWSLRLFLLYKRKWYEQISVITPRQGGGSIVGGGVARRKVAGVSKEVPNRFPTPVFEGSQIGNPFGNDFGTDFEPNQNRFGTDLDMLLKPNPPDRRKPPGTPRKEGGVRRWFFSSGLLLLPRAVSSLGGWSC